MNRDEIAKLLEDRGVLATTQRLDIAEHVLAEPQHLSADQILTAVRAAGSRVSKATVYNTLLAAHGRGRPGAAVLRFDLLTSSSFL